MNKGLCFSNISYHPERAFSQRFFSQHFEQGSCFPYSPLVNVASEPQQ